MTGNELARWLLEHAGDWPVTVIAPDYACNIPTEVTGVELRRDLAFVPSGALVGKTDVVVVIKSEP